MKNLFAIWAVLFSFTACQPTFDKEAVKKEIVATEKAFQKMTADSGIAKAFYYFADVNATILRENDTLIIGNENIKNYYSQKESKNTSVEWAPDFIDVSADGSLGYTYGHYRWQIINPTGDTAVFAGVFHTVWKRQPDGSWKYVWD